MPEKGFQMYSTLETEIRQVFSKRKTLSGGINHNNWIYFINNKYKEAADKLYVYLKCHSFRIYYIRCLLKFAPAQDISQIIAHKDVTSTMIYNRYSLDKEKGINLISKGIYKEG